MARDQVLSDAQGLESGSPGRMRSLDGLRGIAALSVVVHHALINGFPSLRAVQRSTSPLPCCDAQWWLTHTPLHVFWLGAQDVYVFFVLSGIVLTLPLVKHGRFSWKRYYPSRLIRLYLPAWMSLLLALLTMVIVLHFAPGRGGAGFIDREPLLTVHRVLRDAALVTGTSTISGVLWSLQWEMLFSLLLPLFFVFAVVRQELTVVKLALLLAVSLLGSILLNSVPYVGPAALYLPMFAVGALIATQIRKLDRAADTLSERPWFWPITVTASVLLLCVYWFTLLLSPPQIALDISRFVSFVGAMLLVFIAAFHGPSQRILETPVVQWLGVISFSLYLTHSIPIELTTGFLPPALDPAAALVGAVVAIPLAWGFHTVIEGPTHRLSQRIKRWRSVPSS